MGRSIGGVWLGVCGECVSSAVPLQEQGMSEGADFQSTQGLGLKEDIGKSMNSYL